MGPLCLWKRLIVIYHYSSMYMREKATVGRWSPAPLPKGWICNIIFLRHTFEPTVGRKSLYQVLFGLLVGAKWFLASRLWRLINQMNGGGGDLSQLKLSLRFRSRLSRNSIKRPAPHILGIRCSLNRNPNHVKMPSVLLPHIRHKNERRY